MVAQPISSIAGLSSLPDRQEGAFAAAIERASEGGNADSRPLSSGVVIVAALTADTAGAPAVGAMRISPDGVGDGVVTQVSLSEVQTGNASDAAAGGSSAVVVTTDATGEFTQTTVVTVTDSENGNNSQIAIDISTGDGSGLRTTVTIDSDMLETSGLPGDPRIAFGVLSGKTANGGLGTLILIVPTGTDANGTSSFNITTVQMGTTVDPEQAFRNYGFSGTSGGLLSSSFGGAVAVEICGQQQIVWVNAGRNFAPSFTGEAEADFGVLDPPDAGGGGTVAGAVGKLTLVFEKGRLSGLKDYNGAEIADFDRFIANGIKTGPGSLQIDETLAGTWQNAITTQGNIYVIGTANSSSAYSINVRDDERESRLSRSILNLLEKSSR